MKEIILTNYIKEYIIASQASLDPRVWIDFIKEEGKGLREVLKGDDREDILKSLSDLAYVSIGFNMVSSGAEAIGLFHPDEHKRLLALLVESGKLYDKAVDKMGMATSFVDAFIRVHEAKMASLTKGGKLKKRLTQPDLKDLV